MKDYGCVFSEYEGKLRPIFYIKIELWFKILELNNKKIEKIYEFLIDSGKETYILNINEMGLPATPIEKDILQELLNNSYDIENLNIEELSVKYNLTKEYLENSVDFLKREVKKMRTDLMLYDIKNTQNENNNQDTSSVSSYDGESEIDGENK